MFDAADPKQRLVYRVCSLRGALHGVSFDFCSNCLNCVTAKKRNIAFFIFQVELSKNPISLAEIDQTFKKDKIMVKGMLVALLWEKFLCSSNLTEKSWEKERKNEKKRRKERKKERKIVRKKERMKEKVMKDSNC